MISNLQEKMKRMEGESMMLQMKTTQSNLKEVGADDLIHNLVEKLKEILVMLENSGSSLTAWLDKVFPRETRKERILHWIHVSAPYVLPGLFLIVLFWLCSRGKGAKMMKAPGRNFRMPRTVFEADPKGYFRSLHAGKLKF